MALLHPGYDSNPTLYWFIWIFVVVYVIGSGIYIGVFVQNTSTIYTYFARPGLPGAELLSYRYTFTDVAVRLTVMAHILIPLFIMTLVAYRKNYGCNVVWFALYLIGFLMTLLGLGATAGSYANCNGAGQMGNICNDLRYCCALLDPKCPNVIACTDPVVPADQLTPNADFLGLFWTNVVLFAMQLCFVLVLAFSSRREGEEEEEKEEEEKEPEKEEVYVPKTAPSLTGVPIVVQRPRRRLAHGLREGAK